MTTAELARAILKAAHSSEGVDVTTIRAGKFIADLLQEIEVQAQREPGYSTGWLEIVGDYCTDRLELTGRK